MSLVITITIGNRLLLRIRSRRRRGGFKEIREKKEKYLEGGGEFAIGIEEERENIDLYFND